MRGAMDCNCRRLAAFLFAGLLVCGCGRAPIELVNWNVMGTIAAVQTKGDRDGVRTGKVAAAAMAEFKDLETLLNAHDPESEISRLAPQPDAQVLRQCAKEVKPCYEAAFMLCKATGGAFNPRWRGRGTLDLGAIAKGFAVDRACDALAGAEADVPCLIDLGGNVKSLRGDWRTGVKAVRGDGFAAVVDLHEGEALATSATYYRGSHIRDGRTGAVVSNGVASVTVLCRSAMLADGLSTSLFVLGPEKGRLLLQEMAQRLAQPVAVYWIMDDGRAFGDARFEQRR